MALQPTTQPVTPAGALGNAGAAGVVYPGMAKSIAQAAAAQLRKASKKSAAPTDPTAGTPLDQAKAQASAETAGAIAPIQGEIGLLNKQGQQQQTALTGEYNQLLPWATQNANETQQFNQDMSKDAQGIFQEAGQQLNTLQQNQAAQAQRLAQQTGAPVSTGVFTSESDPFRTAEGQASAVGRLTTDYLGTVGTDQARAFAGQVLPAMEASDKATVRNNLNDQVLKLTNQITQLKGNESKLVDAKLPALQASQRNWELQLKNLALHRLQLKHSWDATTRALDQKDRQLGDAEAAQMFGEGITSAKLKITQEQVDAAVAHMTAADKLAAGRLGLSEQQYARQVIRDQAQIAHMTAQDKLAAEKLGISEQEYVLRADHYTTTDKLAKERLQVQQEANARHILDAALGGSDSTKPVTETVKQYLDAQDPRVKAAMAYVAIPGKQPPSNIFHDPKTNRWYTYQRMTYTPQQWATITGSSGTPVSDPNALYRILTHTHIPKGMAEDLIRVRLGLPDWKPGQPAHYDAATLAKMSIGDLTSLAESRGFKPSPLKVTRQQLIDYIHASGLN